MGKRRREIPLHLDPTLRVATFTEGLEGILANYSEHQRLKVFHHKGLACVSCDRVGDTIALWFDAGWDGRPNKGLHVDLLAGDVLMTVDHIYPKCMGGSYHIDNLNPMCAPCNQKKGCQYDYPRKDV